jgi:3-methyladenine DNA glycosylase AlkD
MNAATRGIVDELRAVSDPSRLPGMARVGINVDRAIGVSIPNCRRIARRHRGDHELALRLWTTGIHEVRIVAAMVDDPAEVTVEQMDGWVIDLDSWDLCDQVCGNLFARTPTSFDRAEAWVRREEEFVVRAGFAIVASRAAWDHRPETRDAIFLPWLAEIERAATDDRNYVKKAVNWALRQIGKRSAELNEAAIARCERLIETGSRSARWIGRDALRELRSEDVQRRLRATAP